ncbi:HD domain-containing protein [Candidatus Peregrinibacteria bacterium]|nr:HD domain-containing protein [Candidatus Peregrinibacteria bacterium]
MDKKVILKKVADHVREKMSSEGSGHDWWHIVRVWNMARHLAKEEKADLFVVELGALLHDIADYKFHGGDYSVGPRVAREVMEPLGVDLETMDHVCDIVATISFKGGVNREGMRTLEGKIVQDADRLDAIGAMGIARVFAFGGNRNRPMHDPDQKPQTYKNKEEYIAAFKKNEGTSINHFYEKLLLLKDRMNTKAATEIAKSRHEFMEGYLNQFYAEWEGKR